MKERKYGILKGLASTCESDHSLEMTSTCTIASDLLLAFVEAFM